MDGEIRAVQPTVFIMVTELETVDAILCIPGMYDLEDSPHGMMLKRLLTEGSSLGMHLLLSFDCVGAFKQVLDIRRDLEYCRHRVALQMGEDDAYDLVRSRKASQLGTDKPIRALYFEMRTPMRPWPNTDAGSKLCGQYQFNPLLLGGSKAISQQQGILHDEYS